MIEITVGFKQSRKRGGNRLPRMYLQCRDGSQQWREYLPFYLTGDSTVDAELIERAHEVVKSRKVEHARLERFADRMK